MIYLTIKQASDHLRLDIDLEPAGSPPSDDLRVDELELKMAEAEFAVLDYLKISEESGSPSWPWDEDTVPPPVRAATLIVLAKLWDKNGVPLEDGSAEVSLLAMRRDPTLA